MRGDGKTDDTCPRCKGYGLIYTGGVPWEPDDCPRCRGKGVVVLYDDAEGIVWEGEPIGTS